MRSSVPVGPETWVSPERCPNCPSATGLRTRCALGRRAQIGLACAAGRVNVNGLDSWLARVEQPPRTDEDSETQDIARTFLSGLSKRLRRQGTAGEACREPSEWLASFCRSLLSGSPAGLLVALHVAVRTASELSASVTHVARSQTAPVSRTSRPGPQRRAGRAYVALGRRSFGSARSEVPTEREEVRWADRDPMSRRRRVTRTSLQTRRPRGDDSGPATSLERRLHVQKEP